ncbi:fatty-acyl-CoA synthase [Fontimonas thermophila]|uniref:Fatty-acyl-CoA synthase n=1 Tax=Fontimonas thermophila TaxID=1076937 RepID=A0A1I2KAF6_9GAMM|nr:long-chain fatty acid--CoA ligase [Fontimonas thermophila]SFF62101.1 fatty-acyl-CoA synthase [Fontimonas thermophila]
MNPDIAAARARLTPQRPALQFRGRWYCYAELDHRAQKLAVRLHAAGVRRGDRVAIMATNHIAHVDLLLAAPRLGYIATPFNTRLSADEQTRLARYVEPVLMLHDHACASLAAATGVPLRALDDYEDWLATAEDRALPDAGIGGEDPAMLLFTGGSTGLPKGALIPHRQLFYNAVNTCFSWGVGEHDCAIQATPAFHAAFNVLTTPLLHAGGRVILQEGFEAGEYLRLVERERVTLMFLVPTMFQMLAEHADFATTDFSSVRWTISGGAPCPEPVQQAFRARGVRFKQGYGMTEAGVNCFAIDVEEAQRRPDSVGKPVLHAQAVIRAADGQPVARGEIGELTLAGPHLMLGYFRRPEETAQTLRDGWLWTGDLAREDADGFFYIVGRRKDMYISGGENVYPAEVEAALAQCAGVAECAVVGVPDSRWGEVGLAAVRLAPGVQMDAQTLRAALKQRLAGYKVPKHVLFLESLPKSGAGKILKSEIRRLFEQENGCVH